MAQPPTTVHTGGRPCPDVFSEAAGQCWCGPRRRCCPERPFCLPLPGPPESRSGRGASVCGAGGSGFLGSSVSRKLHGTVGPAGGSRSVISAGNPEERLSEGPWLPSGVWKEQGGWGRESALNQWLQGNVHPAEGPGAPGVWWLWPRQPQGTGSQAWRCPQSVSPPWQARSPWRG